MIILTGYQGFIGQAFKKRLDPENLYRIEQSGAFDFLSQYDNCLLYTSPSPRDRG